MWVTSIPKLVYTHGVYRVWNIQLAICLLGWCNDVWRETAGAELGPSWDPPIAPRMSPVCRLECCCSDLVINPKFRSPQLVARLVFHTNVLSLLLWMDGKWRNNNKNKKETHTHKRADDGSQRERQGLIYSRRLVFISFVRITRCSVPRPSQ
jgi:hypothetical protein